MSNKHERKRRAVGAFAAMAVCAAFAMGSSHALAGEKAKSTGMTLAAAHALADHGLMDMVELPTMHQVDPTACTTLVLDRQSKQTAERACPNDGLALRLEGGDVREDRANVSSATTR